VSFDVAADAYGRFVGAWSEPLAPAFADLAGVVRGDRVLDVGCGPGALTAELVRRLGPDAVAAIDPSAPFVAAVRARFPDLDVRRAAAEDLPFADATFDRTLAQLVVHFMDDPVRGVIEMARVTCPGGTVAAAVWDHAGGGGPLTAFWRAVHDVDPDAPGEAALPGTREGHLAELVRAAGLGDVRSTSLGVTRTFATVDDWWEAFTFGVGPAGAYLARVSPEVRDAVRRRSAELLPSPPFTLTARAWAVRAAV
jgi:SAM-dependent methyltransferase